MKAGIGAGLLVYKLSLNMMDAEQFAGGIIHMTEPHVPGDGFLQATLSEVLAAASRIEGVDIALALSQISGKQNVLEASIEGTAYSLNEKVRNMDACIRAGDLYGFSIEAHGLKSAFACIGATRYYRLASELEIVSKGGDMTLSKEKFQTFSDLMAGFDEKLKAIFVSDGSKDKEKGDCKLLLQVAGDAAGSLDAFEADEALEHLSRLDGFSFGDEEDAILIRIKGLIKGFKYDEACKMLKSILGS